MVELKYYDFTRVKFSEKSDNIAENCRTTCYMAC